MPANFYLAPPAKTVDGLDAVPIDIGSIEAVFTFDGSTSTASADATITYTVGPQGGNPFFDLRQEIASAWIDGLPFPVAQLAHHTFGSGSFTDLRVIESAQAAGSVHTLRVRYTLDIPDSQLNPGYLPLLEWSAGPLLKFAFGLSDLNRARYAEAWLPANLLFDQYSISLEIQVIGTVAAHSVITNGTITGLGPNHWKIDFPERFSAISPLLEVRASDTLTQQNGTVLLPVSGKTVTIESWKLTSSTIDLVTEINNIKTLLTSYENAWGPYLHDNRFVVFFNGSGGMEYEGGTTVSSWALSHETFHSWFARGIKPSSQADGWWDEGLAEFNDDGADDAVPFDFSGAPVVLCSRDPWQRHTPGNAYSDGNSFWKGIASILGIATFKSLIKDLYLANAGNPVSTQMIEEFLVCRSGSTAVVDAFHRFVYGFLDPSPVPDLWFRDDTGDSGADSWPGTFWDSPDLWIRNEDDGGTTHQEPRAGYDNWFYANVRNKDGAGTARHFVVTFQSRGFAGTEFLYPDDFFPCIAATAGFDLGPGETRTVRARWPKELVPPAGTHTCMLASVLSRSDHPVTGRHVWEHNNLAQKNLTVCCLPAGEFLVIPVVINNRGQTGGSRFDLEVWRPETAGDLSVSILHTSKDFFRHDRIKVQSIEYAEKMARVTRDPVLFECGGYVPEKKGENRGAVMTSMTPGLIKHRFRAGWEAVISSRGKPGLAVEVQPSAQTVIGLKIGLPEDAKPGTSHLMHFVQRAKKNKKIIGGIAVRITVSGSRPEILHGEERAPRKSC